MFKHFQSVYAKKEVTYGTDPVPVKTLNAILTGPVDIESVFKKMDRLNVKQYLGNRASVSIGEQVKVSFETEVRGSGDSTPNTPPEIGVLFVGCNMAEDIDKSSGALSITFVAATKKVTRGAGSFVTDGFEVGDIVTCDAVLNPGPFTVTVVAALEMTFSETVADEGPVTKTLTANKVVYTPSDTLDGNSITLYVQEHDLLYKVTGCRGTWSLDTKSAEYAKIKWEFQGLYVGPIDSAIETGIVYNATIPPAVKAATFSLGSFDTEAIIDTFKLTYGNELARRPSVNAATGTLSYFIKERKTLIQIDPEAVALATWDPITLLTAGTTAPLAFTIGSTAGNRMRINCPQVSIDSAKFGDREGLLTWDGSLLVEPTSAGQDDTKVTFN